jgi:hypothetical protein
MDLYKDFDQEVQDYLEKYSSNPSALMRILHRLGIPLPGNPDDAHQAIADYLTQHGEKEFKVRMGLVRIPTQVTPFPPTNPQQKRKPLQWKDKAQKNQLTESDISNITGSQLTPKTPLGQKSLNESDLKPAAPQPSAPKPAPITPATPKEADAQPPAESPKSTAPQTLKDFPESTISEAAREAEAKGENPFGPAPLLDRRSGIDRRTGRDRRQEIELVFRNSRYGADRRSKQDRRMEPPPYRDSSRDAEDCVGNPELKAAGWKPSAIEEMREAKKKKEEAKDE